VSGGPLAIAQPALQQPVRRPDLQAGVDADDIPRPDAFPHTRRPLPWCLAAFLTMLFNVPVDATTVNVHLPVGSNIDRFAIVALVVAWFVFRGDQRAFRRTHRSKLFAGSACVFFAVAVASLLLNAHTVIHLNDLNQFSLNEFKAAEKRFGLLISFLILAWFTMSALRYEDLKGFATFLTGLASVTSFFVLVERHTGYNVFYIWNTAILKPIATLGPSPTDIHPSIDSGGRVNVVGPTLHGLALTTMLMIVMAFPLVRMFDARSRRTRLLNGGALALMLAAAASTDRRTALFVPVAVVVYVVVYRRRFIRKRYLPLALVLLAGFVHFASPGALGVVLNPTGGSGTALSTAHREGDFAAIQPDIVSHLLLGRGFGTIDPDDPQNFRINDNEYLDEIWEGGVVGIVAYIWMILSAPALARRAIRGDDWERSQLTLAASAGCIAFLVVSGLFDALAFPQAPYLFFVAAALTTVAAAGPEPATMSGRSTSERPTVSPVAAHPVKREHRAIPLPRSDFSGRRHASPRTHNRLR
jgi:hypothetical protein